MKAIKLVLPMLVLLAFSLVLSGCPGKQMMSNGGAMQSQQGMGR
jgi:hypothetical protein